MVKINISSGDDILYDISFIGKFCIIQGCSGVGKTALIRTIMEVNRMYTYHMTIDGEEVDNTSIVMLKSIPKSEAIVKEYKEGKFIFVIDDDEREDLTERAIDILKHSIQARYIILSRELKVQDVCGYAINYSVNNVYRMFTINRTTHKIIRYIDMFDRVTMTTGTLYGGTKRCVLCEDSKSGYQFYKRFFKSTVFTIKDRNGRRSGKDSAIDCLNRLLLEYDNIVVILDWCSFGSNISELSNVIKFNRHKQLLLTMDIPSFEYLLLNTNLVNKKMSSLGIGINESDLVKCESEERYYESLLEEVTRNEAFYQKHGNDLGRCYIEPCCFDKRKSDMCSYWINSRDKIDGLLSGSRLEEFFKLRRY